MTVCLIVAVIIVLFVLGMVALMAELMIGPFRERPVPEREPDYTDQATFPWPTPFDAEVTVRTNGTYLSANKPYKLLELGADMASCQIVAYTETREGIEYDAKELAAQNPGKRYMILGPLATVQADVPVTVKDWR